MNHDNRKNYTAVFEINGKEQRMVFSSSNPSTTQSALKADAKVEYSRRGGDSSKMSKLRVI